MLRLLLASALSITAFTLLFSAVQGGKQEPSLSIVEAAPYHYGDTIHFNAVGSHGTNNLYINLLCYQNGVLVLNTYEAVEFMSGWFLGDTGQNAAWTSGAAHCRAEMYYQHKFNSPEAILEFDVEA